MRALAILAVLSLSACVSASTDAGCISYGIARGEAPGVPLPSGPWGDWIARSLDARMTGTCR